MTDLIPFVDLRTQHDAIKNEIDHVIRDVIEKSLFVRGPYVEKFEAMFAEKMERKYCVSCANGTDALYIAMTALGLKTGDEVIVPAHTWISTAETVTQAGGKVVFCDTDDSTFTIDPEDIEKKINKNTVGIIPVHLYGQPADMDSIMELAKRHNLWVLEDCAQAHLARYKGQLVGTFGDIASFSFYPGKNLGAMGDAGAVVTDDQSLALKMTMFARHGGVKKGEHDIEGINSRMDGIQAAILSVKLNYLSQWTRMRQEVAALYSDLLGKVESVETPRVAEGREHVWHLYVIKHEERDLLSKYLNNNGIQTGINYPRAVPYLKAYSNLRHTSEDFPNAYASQFSVLSLPMFPELSVIQVKRIAETIIQYSENSK